MCKDQIYVHETALTLQIRMHVRAFCFIYLVPRFAVTRAPHASPPLSSPCPGTFYELILMGAPPPHILHANIGGRKM